MVAVMVAPAPKPALIELRGITKIFQTDEVETHALSDIHLSIAPGEYVSIEGGTPVASLSAAARARVRNRTIGFVFQAFNLIGDLTVFENVELPLTYRGISADERQRRVRTALERVGMSYRARHYPQQLSGGQQQRVAVARAVAGEPAVLLADEPTGNLDSENGAAVMDLLSELHREGATICMVTHDPRYARRAGRTVRLLDGKIVSSG
jgi:putative ABC transport system ATP-binding protein